MERLNTMTVNAPLGILFRMVWARLASSREPAHGRVLTCTTCEAEHARLWAGHVMRRFRGRGGRLRSSEFLSHSRPSPVRVSRNPARPRRPHAHRSSTARPHASSGRQAAASHAQGGISRDGIRMVATAASRRAQRAPRSWPRHPLMPHATPHGQRARQPPSPLTRTLPKSVRGASSRQWGAYFAYLSRCPARVRSR